MKNDRYHRNQAFSMCTILGFICTRAVGYPWDTEKRNTLRDEDPSIAKPNNFETLVKNTWKMLIKAQLLQTVARIVFFRILYFLNESSHKNSHNNTDNNFDKMYDRQ